MNEFDRHLQLITRINFLCLSVVLLGWAFFMEWQTYFAGFALGATVSLLNAHYTALKIRQLGDMAVNPSGSSNKRVNLGFITRASTSLLAIILSLKTQYFEFSTTLAGLFLSQLISLGVGIYINTRNKGGS